MIKLMKKNELYKFAENAYNNKDNSMIIYGKKNGKIYNVRENKLMLMCYDLLCVDRFGDKYISDINFFENKKFTYKDFDKVYLGFSDIAALKIFSYDNTRGLEANILKMGSDGDYEAYYCNNAIISEHYKKVYSVDGWLEIYDDNQKMFDEHGKFEIYRAGDFGIIINKITT